MSVSRAFTSRTDRTSAQDVVWNEFLLPIISVSFRVRSAIGPFPSTAAAARCSGHFQDGVFRPERIRYTRSAVQIVGPVAVDQDAELVGARLELEVRAVAAAAQRLHGDAFRGPTGEIPGQHHLPAFSDADDDRNLTGLRRRGPAQLDGWHGQSLLRQFLGFIPRSSEPQRRNLLLSYWIRRGSSASPSESSDSGGRSESTSSGRQNDRHPPPSGTRILFQSPGTIECCVESAFSGSLPGASHRAIPKAL